MKFEELKGKSQQDLNKQLETLLEEQFRLRMQNSTGQLTQVHLLKQTRREIAQVKTALGQS